MQRTVYTTKFTYAKTELVNDEIVTEKATITVAELDEKRALKLAIKSVGLFNPLKVEKLRQLYTLDDDIFFKYAQAVGEPEIVE